MTSEGLVDSNKLNTTKNLFLIMKKNRVMTNNLRVGNFLMEL